MTCDRTAGHDGAHRCDDERTETRHTWGARRTLSTSASDGRARRWQLHGYDDDEP